MNRKYMVLAAMLARMGHSVSKKIIVMDSGTVVFNKHEEGELERGIEAFIEEKVKSNEDKMLELRKYAATIKPIYDNRFPSKKDISDMKFKKKQEMYRRRQKK